MNLKKIYIFITALVLSINTFGQATGPSLEFAKIAGDSNPTGNGPVNATAINFVKNTDNPTSNTFANHTPILTATFTLSNPNPSYVNPNYNFSQTGGAVAIGAILTGASAIYNTSFGAPLSTNFTSSDATTGNGISVGSNGNMFVEFLTSTVFARANNLASNGRYYVQKLTISFNRAVNNPILHIGGLGGQFGLSGSTTLGFSSEFNVSANVPVSLTRLSGSTAFSVSGSQINNGGSTIRATGDTTTGSGSVRITGTGITTITLDIYIRGDGNAPSSYWADFNTGTASGDNFSIGISTLESDLSITKTVDKSTPDIAENVIFTITATNNGVSNNTNTTVSDVLPSGYSYVSSSVSTGSYDNSTSVWSIGSLATGANATLTLTAKVKSTGSYANTATVSGDLLDPNNTNNSATSTPIPTGYCRKIGNAIAGGLPTKVGITNQTKLSTWPGAIPNGHIALESKTNGFVITRVANSGAIAAPKKGMLIYDIAASCVKLYNGTAWKCIARSCNE